MRKKPDNPAFVSCLAIDTETPGLEVKRGVRPFTVTMCDGESNWCYTWKVDPIHRTSSPKKSDIAAINKVIKGYDNLIFHNAKFDVSMLATIGIDLTNDWHRIHDTALASHALDSREDFGRHRLKPLAKRYLGIPDTDQQYLQSRTIEARHIAKGRGWTLAEDVEADYWMPGQIWPKDTALADYATADAERTFLLWVKAFGPALVEQGLWDQYMKHRRIMPVIAAMEDRGVTIRPRVLKSELKRINGLRDDAAEIAYNLVPKEICDNLASGQKLAKALYEHHRLPVLYRTPASNTYPDGQPCTDAETLKELSTKAKPKSKAWQFIEAVRTQIKAGTAAKYLQGYEDRKITRDDGVTLLYPSFNICGTATLRLSASNPNPQNVGKGKELEYDDGSTYIDFKLRTVFGPAPGRIWYALDYDQLQLRIFAKASGESRMQQAFADGFDFHTWMGCEIFGVAPGDLTKLQRRVAKNVNFGFIFGAGPAKIEATSGVKGLSAKLKVMFPNVAEFMKETISKASQYGYVHTLGGYRLSIEKKRAYAGVCIIVQGTEGEIVKEAMVRIDNALFESGDDFYMSLQVHDELIFDANTKQKKEHLPRLRMIKREMEAAGLVSGVTVVANCEANPVHWADPIKLAL